jgi:hypothetical protein
MRKARVVTGGILAVATFALSSSSALGDTPSPVGSPGCYGLIVASINGNSGEFGASGNPNASAGPGYFLKEETPDAVQGVQEAFCS